MTNKEPGKILFLPGSLLLGNRSANQTSRSAFA